MDRLTESRPVDALRQRALRHADAFLALVRSSAPTGPRSMLSPDFGSRLGQATRSFGLVLASGKATAADRTVFQQVLNAARTEADSVGDEAWIAYLDVIAGDAAIEHSVADAQVDGLIDFEIDDHRASSSCTGSSSRGAQTDAIAILRDNRLYGYIYAGSYVVELTYTTGVIEFPFVFTGGEPPRLRLTVPSLVYDRTRYALLAEGGDSRWRPVSLGCASTPSLEMPTYLIAPTRFLPGILEFLNSLLDRLGSKSHEACAKRSRE